MNTQTTLRTEAQANDFLAYAKQAQERFIYATSVDQLEYVLRGECTRLGFHSYIYALRVPTSYSNAQIIMLDGYPEGWVKRYFEKAYFDVDPVMGWCVKHVVPLLWSNLTLEPGSLAQTMMHEAAEYGLRDGVTMPVHSPQGELGILSLSVNAPPPEARLIAEKNLPYVQLLASQLHQAVRRISGLMEDDDSTLTARERECLSWAADGKTSGEIAQILEITERTVNFHLNNATQKMDAISRQHAVSKAALKRMIQPKPF
jgi:DNA-binding CsgD family transcriptional regulator